GIDWMTLMLSPTPYYPTKLLIHMDDGISDASLSNHTLIIDGPPEISHSDFKFGGGSGEFMTVTGVNQRIAIDCGTTNDFVLDSDFTIEAWINPRTISADNGIFSLKTTSNGGDYIQFGLYRSQFRTNTYVTNPTSWGTPIVGEWQHVAVVRDNDRLLWFHNGILSREESIPSTTVFGGTTNYEIQFGIYGVDKYYFNGYMDEIRVAHVARWTEDFTPPTAPYEH
ncbi:LamG domain-containing protein, partial [Desulfobulbus sp. TB]|nr:LamG domain-containing protein [Desulfobulbus sp. TB]